MTTEVLYRLTCTSCREPTETAELPAACPECGAPWTHLSFTAPKPAQTFPSVEAFYDADGHRRRSVEVDFGVHWTVPGDHWPTWRVSWVVDTGELYAVALLGRGRDDGPLIVHAVYPTREEIERALEGWAEHCQSGGLDWLWKAVA